MAGLLVLCFAFGLAPRVVMAEGTSSAIPLVDKYDVYALANIINGAGSPRDYAEFESSYPEGAKEETARKAFLKTAKYEITNNMTLSSKDGFRGIGVSSPETGFSGSIDGLNHVVTLDINSDDYHGSVSGDYLSFVNYYYKDESLSENPTIENISFNGMVSAIGSYKLAASTVGMMHRGTKLYNVHSDATINNQNAPECSGSIYAAGIVGYASGDLELVSYTGEATSTNTAADQWARVGGICGVADGCALQDIKVDASIAADAHSCVSAGLVSSYTTGADGTPAKFKDVVASGKVDLNAEGDVDLINNGNFLYYGTLGGRADHVEAQDVVVEDAYIHVRNNTAQARVGALIAGVHTKGILTNCLVKDCAIVVDGERGQNNQIGGVLGYAAATLTMEDITSNCSVRFAHGEDLGTGYKLAGFISSASNPTAESAGNLFSANKAGIWTACDVNADKKEEKSRSIAGFRAVDKIALMGTDHNTIAVNSADENSRLDAHDIQWGYRDDTGALVDSLPKGMSICWSPNGNLADLSTSQAAAGDYTLVAFVTKTVAGKKWNVELADIPVSVQESQPNVTSVILEKDGQDISSNALELVHGQSAEVSAKVIADAGADNNGVIWRFYNSSDVEVTAEYLDQYLTISVANGAVELTADRSIRDDVEFSLEAVSVTNPTKVSPRLKVKVKPLEVRFVEFIPIGDAEGSGSEVDPYIVRVGKMLSGYAKITMVDGKVYENQGLKAETATTLKVAKSSHPKETIEAKVDQRDGMVAFAAKSEGLAAIQIQSVAPGEDGKHKLSEPIYILAKASVEKISLSSNVTDNTASIAADKLGETIAKLTPSVSISNYKLYEGGDSQKEIPSDEYAKYRESNKVHLSSSNENVAKIDDAGNVTAVGFGNATFTATSEGKGADGKAVSAQYSLIITNSAKKDQAAPFDLEGVPSTHCDLRDGMIRGLKADQAYEYRSESDSGYTKVAQGESAINGLAPGKYLVRFSETDSLNPSPDLVVNVGRGPKYDRDAPSGLVALNASSAESRDGAISGVDDSMEYSPAYSSFYMPVSGTRIDGLAAGTYYVRYRETETQNASKPIDVEVGVGVIAPGGGSSGDTTTVTKNPDGSTTTTVTRPDGSQTIITETEDGTKSTLEKDKLGKPTSITVVVSDKDAGDGLTELPVEKLEGAGSSSEAITIKIDMPESVTTAKSIQVDVPAKKNANGRANYGLVVCAEGANGEMTVLPKSIVRADGNVVFEATGDVTIKVVDNAKDMSDVTDADWFAGDVVDFATARGIVNGVERPDGSRVFDGYGKTSRGMFVAMLHNLELNPEAASEGSLADVPEGAFYADAAAWALEEGILSGVDMPDGTKQFQGGADVTREQVAVFLMRYADHLGMDVSARAEIDFPDVSEVSGFAKDAMSWAVAEGLFTGDDVTGELNPTDGAARAEVAAVLMRFINLMYA